MSHSKGDRPPLIPQRTWSEFFYDDMRYVNPLRPGTLKKFPELIPVCGTVCFSLTLAVVSLIHAAMNKTDVRFDKYKRDKMGPHEEIGPTQKTKWYTRNPEVYRPIKELEDLKGNLKMNENDNGPCN